MRFLGTLASLEKFVQLGCLHVRPLYFYLKARWDLRTQDEDQLILITKEIKEDLSWWLSEELLSQGISLELMNPDLQLFCDASDKGWGATLGQFEVLSLWEKGCPTFISTGKN